jgi:uncharacterized protein YjbI with pentapeptide repeats
MTIYSSREFDADTFPSINWEGNYFTFCTFEHASPEGHNVTSDFKLCRFRVLDWYWAFFNISNFIECEFTDCTFRGAAFAQCRFIGCKLIHCQFLQDNLNGDCSFPGTVCYDCLIKDSQGFETTIKC